MHKPKKCIIDNWSLEHAGSLLDNTDDLAQKEYESIVRNLGGLSNFINAVLLYEDSFFIVNGFEKDWKRFEWFDANTSAFIKGISLDELAINWTSDASYEDKGISNYLLTSNYFESDLLVCPERSEEIQTCFEKVGSTFGEALREVDRRILLESSNFPFSKVKIGVERNFRFPLITQYVLSEASGRGDLLKVIMQLKSDGKIERVIREIEEITATIKGAGKFEKDIQVLVKKAFGKDSPMDGNYSIGLSAFFFSISKSINLEFFRRKEYLVFIKDLIACRSEAFRVEKDFQRIFLRKLKPL